MPTETWFFLVEKGPKFLCEAPGVDERGLYSPLLLASSDFQ